MEILDPQGSMLCNYEVWKAVKDSDISKNQASKRFENYSTVTFELKNYLKETPCIIQSDEQIAGLMETLIPHPITKAEKLQFINLRPTEPVEINLILEECEERFDDEKVDNLINLIENHLITTNGVENHVEEIEESGMETEVYDTTQLTFEGHSIELQRSVLSDF